MKYYVKVFDPVEFEVKFLAFDYENSKVVLVNQTNQGIKLNAEDFDLPCVKDFIDTHIIRVYEVD